MKERRGVCPGCGQTKAVTARGVMRLHYPKRTEFSPRFMAACDGTGQPPKSYVDEPTSLPPIPIPFPGDENAERFEAGGWSLRRGGPGRGVAVGSWCGVRSPDDRWQCSLYDWPHPWHVAMTDRTHVVAVWPSTDGSPR